MALSLWHWPLFQLEAKASSRPVAAGTPKGPAFHGQNQQPDLGGYIQRGDYNGEVVCAVGRASWPRESADRTQPAVSSKQTRSGQIGVSPGGQLGIVIRFGNVVGIGPAEMDGLGG